MAVENHILKMPPFPRARQPAFVSIEGAKASADEIREACDLIPQLRVGGAFWGARPLISPSAKLLLFPGNIEQCRLMVERASSLHKKEEIILCAEASASGVHYAESVPRDCDPWHLFDHVEEVWIDSGNAVAVLASLAGKAYCLWDDNGPLPGNMIDPLSALERFRYADPFTGEPVSLPETVRLLGFWRNYIEENRGIRAVAGFADWKQANVEPLLWSGDGDVEFLDRLGHLPVGSNVGVWTSRLSRSVKRDISKRKLKTIEVEDGFIRSVGLGAECVPPLSIIVDRKGIYFDPSKGSDLEHILENVRFDTSMLVEARRLRSFIVDARVSKYGPGAVRQVDYKHLAADRNIFLVIGQVEDDRSVQSGGGRIKSNLMLLKEVRERSPDSFIIYRPHPDVLAGLRKGHVPDPVALEYADIVASEGDIIDLIETADEVHVMTSLAGFEALLREKAVTCYGVPFYSGWGLTEDLGEIPERRTKRRSLDELVAASLMIYPRYLDPVTGLPCPAHILVMRLEQGQSRPESLLTRFRKMQGWVRLKMRSLFPGGT